LKKFFGNDFLYLKAVEKEKTDQKEIFFEVLRDEKIAYNLSQGECNLLAFCYFIAKLEETETANSNPVIWIDDPISSLDSNHIFFVYSLLKSKIVDSGSFQQLFISTHNLNFLKYLKRLNDGYNRGFFLINRIGKISSILPMPKYMRKYFTEFNYLFEQIYKCSNIEAIDDSNHKLFYSFGNNARKFLEIYLYYKYPDTSENDEKLKKFFGEDEIPMILTNRLSNEYSHLSGVFERGATPVEVPEIKLVAEKIIDKLKEDEDQYESLLKSIGQNTG
jgi:wobble nucleotide-excising tRNase